MYVIPAVDVLAGKVVRLIEGDFERVTVYSDDPVAQVAVWADRGADWVHVVDLEGARSGRPSISLHARLGRQGVPVQLGGGIRDTATALGAIAGGVGRVVVGTVAVSEPALLREMVEAVGPQHVVVAVDVREGRSVGSGWHDEGRLWQDVVSDVGEAGAVRVLVTGISRDGTMKGPDLDLAAAVSRFAPGLAVIASGGVGEAAHITAAAAAGVEAIIVGKALYDGRLTFADAARAARSG